MQKKSKNTNKAQSDLEKAKEQEKEKKKYGNKTQSRISNPNWPGPSTRFDLGKGWHGVVWAEDHGQLVTLLKF